jgi:hypothetical protein
LYEVPATDLRDRLHDQHPEPGSRDHGSTLGPDADGVPIGRRSPPQRGPSSTPIHRHRGRWSVGAVASTLVVASSAGGGAASNSLARAMLGRHREDPLEPKVAGPSMLGSGRPDRHA